MDTMRIHVAYFKVTNGQPLHLLSPRDQKTVRYATKFIHGLAFYDTLEDSPQCRIDDLVLHLAKDAKNRGGCIAYKGSIEEKKICSRLGISNVVNIENSPFNCPIVYKVIKQFPMSQNIN